MSQFGLNSIPILDQNAMGGFRGGMADNRSLMHSNNQLETEDLAQDEAIQRIEKQKLNTPLEAAERALKLAEAEKLRGEMDQGLWEKDRARKREMENADLQQKLTANQLKTLEMRIQGVQAAGQIFGEDTNPATMAMGWEAAKNEAKQYGFDLGEYSKENAEKFMRMKQSTPMAMKLYQDNIKRQEDLKTDLIKEGAQAGYKSSEAQRHEGWQGGENAKNRASAEKIAATRAAGSGSGSSMPKTWGQLEARTFVKASEYLEGKGEAPSDAEIQLLENKMVRSEAMAILKENPMFSVYFIPGTDQLDPAKVDDKVKRALNEAAALTNSGQLVARLRAKKSGGAAPVAGDTKPAAASPRMQELRNRYKLPGSQ